MIRLEVRHWSTLSLNEVVNDFSVFRLGLSTASYSNEQASSVITVLGDSVGKLIMNDYLFQECVDILF